MGQSDLIHTSSSEATAKGWLNGVSLRVKLIATFLTLSALTIITIAVINNQTTTRTLNRIIGEQLIQEILHNALAADLRFFQAQFPNHVEIFITDHYGALLAATNRTTDYYQADEAWWQATYQQGQGASIAEPAVAALEWRVNAQQERRTALAPIDTYRKTTAWVAGLTALIAAGLGTVMAGWLIRPVQRLTRAARHIIAGNLSVQAEVETRDEIGVLAATFNVMARRLQRMFDGLEQQIQELRAAHTKLQTREQELQESEIRFRTLSESALLGVYIIQNDYFQYVNPAMTKIFGYTADELRYTMPTLALIHPDDRAFVTESLQQRISGEREIAHYVVRGIHKDGAVLTIEILGRRIEYAGQPAVMGNLIDITANKRAQAEISRLAAVIEQVGETIIITDLGGNIVYVNPHFETATGYTTAEVLGQNPRLLKSGQHDGAFYHELWKTITQGKIWRGTITNKRKDGQLYHEATSIFPIRGTDGEISNYASVKRDITAQVRAATEREKLLEQLQESAEQIHQIMNTVPEGVLLLNTDLCIVQRNPVADEYLSALTGDPYDHTHPLTHLGGQPIGELLTAPSHGLWHEVNVKRRRFQIVARPVETSPMLEGWVMVLRDVTQEYETQQNVQRQERLAAIGQMSAGIAHDFNNIIAIIVLYSQMSLRHPDLPDKIKERLVIIAEQGQRASELINQILDFSRSSILDLRPLDMLPMLKEAVRLWQRILPEDIRVELNYQIDTYTINADPTRIQQVLMNLAVNARDAMPNGGTLSVDLARLYVTDRASTPIPDLNPGEWVQITVADTGDGIPNDVLPHIFEPFFTTKAPGEGVGLGLAQVYGIIMHHQGRVAVHTQVGAGTVFTLYLPALHGSHHPDDTALQKALPLGHGETILVVEDNPATCAALCSSLEMLNYRTLEAANGKEALNLFARCRADIALVLTDLVMPTMGGKILAQMLYQQAPDLNIVVMSGHPLDPETDVNITPGVRDWLQKPPSLEHLAETLARVLQG